MTSVRTRAPAAAKRIVTAFFDELTAIQDARHSVVAHAAQKMVREALAERRVSVTPPELHHGPHVRPMRSAKPGPRLIRTVASDDEPQLTPLPRRRRGLTMATGKKVQRGHAMQQAQREAAKFGARAQPKGKTASKVEMAEPPRDYLRCLDLPHLLEEAVRDFDDGTGMLSYEMLVFTSEMALQR